MVIRQFTGTAIAGFFFRVVRIAVAFADVHPVHASVPGLVGVHRIGADLMGWRVGQLVAFVVTGQLFGIQEGIAQAQLPLAANVPAVRQFDTLVTGFAQVLEAAG